MHTQRIEGPSFSLEPVYLVHVNVPSGDVARVLEAVTQATPLRHGNYDRVAYRSASGIEQFRRLRGSRAGEAQVLQEVSTTRITFSVSQEQAVLVKVVEAIRAVHPYEEPVINVEVAWTSRAVRGGDDENPNRCGNRSEQPGSQ